MERLKRILLIGTGGTIASARGESGLVPALSPEALLGGLPGVGRDCVIRCLTLFQLDSTNLRPEHWLAMAETIRTNWTEYDGFVLTHGTDTMAYTAAALSYLIQGSPKPIVLTGGQKPMGVETTDARRNLRDAFTVACSGARGVMVVFDGKLILGTRAHKSYSRSFDAFVSVNYPLLGAVREGRVVSYLTPPAEDVPRFFQALNPRVALMKLIPGASSRAAAHLLEESDGLIIESFGTGGLPDYGGEDFCRVVREGTAAGKTVVLTTQVENEGSDLSIYAVGEQVRRRAPVLEAYDMTTEAAAAKLMWILGQTRERQTVERLFYTPVAADILWGPTDV